MAIEFERNGDTCPYGLHQFKPISEGGQTIGIVCKCGKIVRSDMEYSNITVTDSGAIVEKINNHELPAFKPMSIPRKDPRF